MIYFVEGLNGSGKSTWINTHKEEQDYIFHTTWLNPLRFSDNKRLELSNGKDELYQLFSYETLLRAESILQTPSISDHYWDRSFISSYVYGTISYNIFNKLIDLIDELGLDKSIEFVYVDTDVDVCLFRLWEIRKKQPDYKNYIFSDTPESMKRIKVRFDDVFKRLLNQNYKVRYIKDGKVSTNYDNSL